MQLQSFALYKSLRFFANIWPKNPINEINSPNNAKAKYLWNVLKNHSDNEIRIRGGSPVSQVNLDCSNFFGQPIFLMGAANLYHYCWQWPLQFDWSISQGSRRSNNHLKNIEPGSYMISQGLTQPSLNFSHDFFAVLFPKLQLQQLVIFVQGSD